MPNIVREKDKIDLKTLHNLTDPSSLQRALFMTKKGFEGAGGGLGLGGFIVTILALGGFSISFVFQIIGAAVGGTIFGTLALILGANQLWQQHKKIEKLKPALLTTISNLKASIIDYISNYQLLEDTSSTLDEEIKHLNKVLAKASDKEKASIEARLAELNDEVLKMQALQKEIMARLQISLEIFTGGSNSEKLSLLFGSNGRGPKEALLENCFYQFKSGKMTQDKFSRVERGLNTVWSKIDLSYKENEQYEQDLKDRIGPEKKHRLTGVKAITHSGIALGGFLGGSGLVLTVAILAVGGFAAVLAIGWPILIPALGIGLLAGAGSWLYYRRVERRQEKKMEKVNLAKKQIDGVTSYIKDKANNEVQEIVKNHKARTAELVATVEVVLETRENDLKEYEVRLENHEISVKKIAFDSGHFGSYQFKVATHTQLKMLQKEIEQNHNNLKDLKRRIEEIVVIAGSDDKKVELLNRVNSSLGRAEIVAKDFSPIFQVVEEKLHSNSKQKDLRDALANNLTTLRPTNFPSPDKTHEDLMSEEDQSDDDSDSEGRKLKQQ
ncbi:MAG: hypothetical protein H0U71_03965 [Gammaproteobacteria bacterium]|nr:hypothetical protein [Gammaproteobacteria bacterium]